MSPSRPGKVLEHGAVQLENIEIARCNTNERATLGPVEHPRPSLHLTRREQGLDRAVLRQHPVKRFERFRPPPLPCHGSALHGFLETLKRIQDDLLTNLVALDAKRLLDTPDEARRLIHAPRLRCADASL